MTHSLNASSVKGIRASPLCTGAAIAGFLALAACATTPQPPHRALQSAEMAITHAEQTRVAEYAPAELNQARDKFARPDGGPQRTDGRGRNPRQRVARSR